MAEPARPELARLAGKREPRAARVDEVELVLFLVEVRPRLDAGRDHEHVDAERRHAKLPAHLAEDAVAQLLDRPERIAHAMSASSRPAVESTATRRIRVQQTARSHITTTPAASIIPVSDQ